VRVSRRPLFFLGVGITCLLLYGPTPSQFRWLNLAMAALSCFWFVLLAIEDMTKDPRTGSPPEGDER
jgi:hypothetical protein